MDGKHGRTTSGVTCHHRLWTAYTVERLRASHAIIAFGQHTQSNDVGHCMPSSPLGSTHGQTTSGMPSHHHPWTTHTVGNVGRGMTSPPLDSTHGRQRRAWHDITAFGQHTRSTTLDVACYHCPWTAYTVGRRRTWDDITSLGQHTRSIDVGHGMTSPPLDCMHG